MLMTLLGWLLVASSLALWAMVIVQVRSSDARGKQLDMGIGKTRLDDVEALLKRGKINKAEADAERFAALSRLWSASRTPRQGLQASARTLIVPAVVFLLVACVGAAISHVKDPIEVVGSGESDDEMLTRLVDYTQSLRTEDPAPKAVADKLLPDVTTMTEQLAARLESDPEDVKGWRMLGWSYFQTARYDMAANAYARAVALDPGSAELKQSYEAAKAKASESDGLETASFSQTEPLGQEGGGLNLGATTKSGAMPPHESDAAIRSMVDGLADRLEESPQDVEGWTRLMRSRVVLGEREVATTALRKALEVFRDDSAASGKIMAAAVELGLEAK